MVEGDTAVLDPAAETPEAPEQEPVEETQLASTEETGPDDSNSETYTAEQVEELKQKALDELRAEVQAEAQENARNAERRQVEQSWQDFSGEFGMRYFRDVAAWAVRQAEEGKSQKEVAELVQRIAVKDFEQKLRTTVKPYLYHEAFTEMVSAAESEINSEFKDWKPARDVEAKFRAAVSSGDGGKAVKGLLAYLRQAIEDSEVPAKVKAARDAEQKKTKSAGEVSKLQRGSDATGPAKVGGNASTRDAYSTMLQVDTAFDKGLISFAEMKQYLAKHRAGQLPYS